VSVCVRVYLCVCIIVLCNCLCLNLVGSAAAVRGRESMYVCVSQSVSE
jgi:hypothetical protein